MNLRTATRPLLNLIAGRPTAAVYEVNLTCNSACGYCDLPLNEGRYEMSLAEIERVFTKLYRSGLRHVFVQGGEPTVRVDLPEVLETLKGLGYGLSLVTNGTRLKPALVERLSAVGVRLSVSLDTLDRARYQKIRGADQLPRVLSGIEALKDYPHPKYLTCIVSELNRGDALDVVRFAREKAFIPVVGTYHWDIDRYGKVTPELQFEVDAALAVLREILESGLIPAGYFRNYLKDNIRWLKGEGLGRCDAGRHTIAIDASGNVAPCLAHAHAGNLLEMEVDEVLSAMDHAAIKACSDNSTCNLFCGRVVGENLRNPIAALQTPNFLEPLIAEVSEAAPAVSAGG